MRILILAADHPWRLDITALAGILAAAGTVVLALFTWRLASETRKLAVETGEDVRAEWRPVLVDQGGVRQVQYAHGSNVGRLTVSLLNAGRRPAINVFVEATSETSVEDRHDDTTFGTISPGGAVQARLGNLLYRDSSANSERSRLQYYVNIYYEDLSKRGHHTRLPLFDKAKGSHQWPTPPAKFDSFDVELVETEIDPPDG